MTNSEEPSLDVRVAGLESLSADQRRALRVIALRSPREAEERLEVLLKRWHDVTNRAFVREVLLEGADHDAWVAQHVRYPEPSSVFAAAAGRPLTEQELTDVQSLANLSTDHVMLAKAIRAHGGRMVAAKYLRFVASSSTMGARMDYLEEVIEGRLEHDDWVRSHSSWCERLP